ncbi:hypothetical protein [Salinispora arenicola]|uniref:hypothetical protein n=1 Tax=Salinispora arenicola TaxID=168697 RepID=UPI00036233A3|nr:hypothetical protein [Salinispora arenicola]
MSATPSTRQFVQPAPPIRYGLLSRFADWFHGWRDGRRGLPAAEPSANLVSPAEEALIRAARDAFAHEWIRLEFDLAEPLQRRADAQVRRTFAARVLVEAERELDECLPVPPADELTIRRDGERIASASLVQARRRAEHRRRREALHVVARQARVRLAQIDAEIASFSESAVRRLAIRQARVRRLHQHTQRRLASYRRSLVRWHPKGALIVAELEATKPAIPEWAIAYGSHNPDHMLP